MTEKAKLVSAAFIAAFVAVVNGHYVGLGIVHEHESSLHDDAFSQVIRIECVGTTLLYQWMDVTGHHHTDTLRHARACR